MFNGEWITAACKGGGGSDTHNTGKTAVSSPQRAMATTEILALLARLSLLQAVGLDQLWFACPDNCDVALIQSASLSILAG